MFFSRWMVHRIGYQMSGNIHCKGHDQNRREQGQQGYMNADFDLSAPDLPENPGTQPHQP